MEDPGGFLESTPLIVSIPLETPEEILHFKVSISQTLKNDRGQKPCELELDQNNDGPGAYWCPYKADGAESRDLGNAAGFMFTANMNGCSFAVNVARNKVSHSNAATIGQTINQHGANRAQSSAAQKGFQALMAKQAVGVRGAPDRDARVVHSFGGNCTTIVGVRGQDGWVFYKQVNNVDPTGCIVSVRSMIVIQ
jgi:hypothetical protein